MTDTIGEQLPITLDETLKPVPPGEIPNGFSTEPCVYLPQLTVKQATVPGAETVDTAKPEQEIIAQGERFAIRKSAIEDFVHPSSATEASSLSASGQSVITEVYDTRIKQNVIAKISIYETDITRSIKEEAIALAQNESFLKPTVLDRTKLRIDGKDYDVVLMKKIEGVTLHDLHDKDWKFFWDHPKGFTQIARKAATHIDTCHNEGLLHGDIKPSNIMISDLSGNPLVFEKPDESELTRIQERVTALPSVTYVDGQGTSRTDLQKLTRPSQPGIPLFATEEQNTIGVRMIDFGSAHQLDKITDNTIIPTTSYYAPPEMLVKTGAPIDQPSDIHAFGMTMYDLLTNPYPAQKNGYDGSLRIKNRTDLIPHVHTTEQNTLAQNCLPDAVYKVIQKATAYKPEERYETATAFVDDLLKALEETHWQKLE
jgi:serine/threonine protein kinase